MPRFERGVARLRTRYDVSFDPGVTTRTGFLAGDDDRRRAELVAALDDDAVDAVVAVRGGYGATRLLPSLAPADVARANKVLVGFSDITALHALWARAGLRSLHASMVAALADAPDERFARWCAALEGRSAPNRWAVEGMVDGIAEGPVIGGNLAVLTALVGTPYLPPLEGAVLLLEDVGEAPYRIDRMLTTLAQAGVVARVAGVAFGTFVDCRPGPAGVTAGEVVAAHARSWGKPAVSGLPVGHQDDNVELALGAPVRVDGTRGTLSLGSGLAPAANAQT